MEEAMTALVADMREFNLSYSEEKQYDEGN